MPITLDRITIKTEPGKVPIWSHHGYIIHPTGDVYALLHPWTHGLILALLYPDMLARFNVEADPSDIPEVFDDDTGEFIKRALEIPKDTDNLQVMDFQRFEHWLPVHECVRICGSRMMGQTPISLDKPDAGCTLAQEIATRLCMIQLGVGPADLVCTNNRDLRLIEIWDWLLTSDDVYSIKHAEPDEPNDFDEFR